MSFPCTGSILTPLALHTSMHSLIIAWAHLRAFLLSHTAPKVSPITTDMPEKAEFIRSLDHREPIKLSETVTGPISWSMAFTFPRCFFPLSLIAPISKHSLSGEDVRVLCPLCFMVAPQPIVQPRVLSSPTIPAIRGSGSPFWVVQIAPSSFRCSQRNRTTESFSSCLVMRKM